MSPELNAESIRRLGTYNSKWDEGRDGKWRVWREEGPPDFALAAGLRVLSCYWSYIVQLGGKWGRTINTKEQGFSSSGAPMKAIAKMWFRPRALQSYSWLFISAPLKSCLQTFYISTKTLDTQAYITAVRDRDMKLHIWKSVDVARKLDFLFSHSITNTLKYNPSMWIIKSNQIKSLLLSHHHSTSALVSDYLL